MKNLFLNNSMEFICKYQSFSELEKKKLRYGLEGIYLTITKLIILIIIAVALNMLKEFIIITILFNIIRYTGFGFHAEKSWQCLLFSTFNFILIPYSLFNLELSNTIVLGICVLSILHFLLFAPADTKKRPLPNQKKRAIRKFITVIVGCFYTLLIICLDSNYWTNILLSVLIIQAIVISPITYWLFGQPYHNYKKLSAN